jgi:hypothetical protein
MFGKRTTAVGLCLAVAGCNVLPVASYDRDSIIDNARKRDAKINSLSIDDARYLAVGWRDTLETATISRRNQMLIAEEVLYYGTLMLVGAQAAIAKEGAGEVSKRLQYARNAGAVTSLGSSLFSSHYNTAVQQPVFEKAAARMRCVTDAIADISQENRASFDSDAYAKVTGVDGKEFSELETEAPRRIVQFIERKSLPDLRAALGAINLGMPTRTELEEVIKRYRDTSAEAHNVEKTRRAGSDTASAKAAEAARLAKVADQAAQKAKEAEEEFRQAEQKGGADPKEREAAQQKKTEAEKKKADAQRAATDAAKEAADQAKKEENQHRYVLAVKLLPANLETCATTYPQ